MISNRTARKFKKNSFIFWYKWITGALNNNTVKNYQILQLNDKRNDKIPLYSGLYSDFQKLNVERNFNYKSDKVFVEKLPLEKMNLWIQ